MYLSKIVTTLIIKCRSGFRGGGGGGGGGAPGARPPKIGKRRLYYMTFTVTTIVTYCDWNIYTSAFDITKSLRPN